MLIPAEAPEEGGFEILTWPILDRSDCFTSALKVLAVLTVPLTDLISLVVYAVVATEITPLSTPLKINCSPATKLPLVLYAVTSVELLTPYLKYPIAPLDFPLIWVGTVNVVGLFKAILVYGWISYKAISHSFKSVLLTSYEPDSKAKSYTRANPISLPAAVVPAAPTLWSLRLTV